MSIKVNGQRIPSTELIAEESRIKTELRNARRQELSPHELQRHAQDGVIDRYVLRQEAIRRAPRFEAADIKAKIQELCEECGGETELYRRLQIKQGDEQALRKVILEDLQVNRLMDKILADLPEVTEQDCFNFYMRHIADFSEPERINASHIVKHVDEDCDKETALAHMKQVKAELDAGGDFGALANQYSSCPGEGAELGFFTRGQMVQGFEDVVFQMQPGQISDVFLTEFGCHIAKVNERLPSKIQPLSDVQEQLQAYLESQAESERIQEYVAELRTRARIEIT